MERMHHDETNGQQRRFVRARVSIECNLQSDYPIHKEVFSS
jgi:hypothetical protein